MRPIGVLLLTWWFVMQATAGNNNQPIVVGPFQEKQPCEQERIFWTTRGFVTSLQCFQG